MTPENKQFILEIDNSGLIDCTLQWLNMLNNHLQQKIADRVSAVVKKEEEDVRVHEVTKEPVVPPATKVSVEIQTDVPTRV